jgi:hypothetical protein
VAKAAPACPTHALKVALMPVAASAFSLTQNKRIG